MRFCSTFAILLLGTIATAADNPISEFELSTPGHRPQAVVAGPDGNIWVTEVLKKKIVRITPDGKITEFPVPGDKVGVLQGIASGPDGNLWFTSREENAIRCVSVKGEFVAKYPIGRQASHKNPVTPGCWPRGIAAGPDGHLWFAEMAADRLGQMAIDGQLDGEFLVPTLGSDPYAVAFDKLGRVWFTESKADKVGRLDPKTGKIDEFKLPTAKAFPRDIVTGPDGNLWFSENQADKIGRVTPEGVVTEFSVPTGSRPVGVAAGADGNIWFAAFGTGKIGRLRMDGTVTMFDVSTPKSQPFGMAAGPDGNIWFAEQANRIGRVNLKMLSGK